MKNFILSLIIGVLGIFVLPATTASALDGVSDGSGGDGSYSEPGDNFEVQDWDTGERYACVVVSFAGGAWTIKCESLLNHDVFTVRVFINLNVLVHEVTVSTVVSTGSTPQSLAKRSTGLSQSIRDKSPFGQTNYNTWLVSSNALYNNSFAVTRAQATAIAEAERQTCFSYFPGDVQCDSGYRDYLYAENNYLALQNIASAGFRTPISAPVYAGSYFPAYPIPNSDPIPSSSTC